MVKSGDWVDYGWCTNHPIALDKALAARQNELHDVNVRGGVTMWMPEICKAEDAGEHFTWNSWHCSGVDRKIIAKGMGYFIPMRYSELPRFYRDGNATVDVAMIQVTPMDKPRQLQLRPGCLPPGRHALLCQKASLSRSTRICPVVYSLTGGEINIAGCGYGGGGGQSPRGPAGRRRRAPARWTRPWPTWWYPEIPNGACLQLGIGGHAQHHRQP